MKIIFMGTPDFAVTSLNKIKEEGIEVAAVVTVPDRKSGRGLKVNASPVKERAVELGLPVLQPEKLKDESFINELKKIDADLFVVVAFRMLPEVVWKLPKKGTINLHGSLLPQYRGAAPINWAIINGEQETGVTTFFIDEKIDTGGIIQNRKIPIHPNETAGELHDKMMFIGAELLTDTIKNIFNDSVTIKSQKEVDENSINNAPKIFKQDCLINWNNKASNVYNKIRGLSPYPAAWCKIDTPTGIKTMKLYLVDLIKDQKAIPGSIKIDEKKILFGAEDGWLKLKEIQMEGKKRMKIQDFLNGFDFNNCKLI